MDLKPIDENAIGSLTSIVGLISETLDTAHDTWRDHVKSIRDITAVLEFDATRVDESRKQWQLSVITAFQRVAYADADSGGVPDIGNWCLKQAVTLLQIYPEDVELLTLVGQNWLSRAQRSLASIHLTEQDSSSSGGSQFVSLSPTVEAKQAKGNSGESECRLYMPDYVEARGVLLPAVEYMKRATDAAQAQGKLKGGLLAMAAEASMSLGNVSPLRTNGLYYQQALLYLRTAKELPGYILPLHLQIYLEEYGSLIEGSTH